MMISSHTCPIASEEGKETGGLNVYVLELSKALGKLGYSVDMYTRSQDRHQPYIVEVSPQVRVIHIPAGPEKPYPKRDLLNHLDEFVDNVIGHLKKEKLNYDLIHCHYYISGLIGLKLKQKLNQKIPLITTFHTLALMKNLVARNTDELETKFRINTEFDLIQKSDHIVATSQSDKDYLMYLYKCPRNKISVLTPGVDLNFFKPLDKDFAKQQISANIKEKIILAIGRVEPLKGFDVLIYALKILLEKNPALNKTLSLWIVGGEITEQALAWPSELDKLESLKKTLGLSTEVKFVGIQPQVKLPYFYSAAEIVAMPSHYESFGMVALEAMACGTPVIATNVSGISKMLEKYEESIITSANNPLLLAQQLEHFILRPKRLSSRIRLHQAVQRHSWHQAAQKAQNIYQQL